MGYNAIPESKRLRAFRNGESRNGDVMRAVFLDFGSVTRGDLDCTKLENAISSWQYYDETSPQQIVERIKTAEVVVSSKTFLDRAVIDSASHLKLICIAATGYNNVDLNAAAERNIGVCNVRNYATDSVAQHVVMLMLNLVRRFVEYQSYIKHGKWQACAHFCSLDYGIEDLSGKILGIIGYGELGRAVGKIGQAFGMQLRIAEHKGQPPRSGRLSFEEVLSESDFISLHCPLTAQTHHLITRTELALMKSTAYLINTARGKLINEADLLESLIAGGIAGAALDVLSEEPPTKGNILLTYPHPNLIITPHVAWTSQAARQCLLDKIADNITHFFEGKPYNQVPEQSE